jgi:hypothetical protein
VPSDRLDICERIERLLSILPKVREPRHRELIMSLIAHLESRWDALSAARRVAESDLSQKPGRISSMAHNTDRCTSAGGHERRASGRRFASVDVGRTRTDRHSVNCKDLGGRVQ